jgi:hypothetical protein
MAPVPTPDAVSERDYAPVLPLLVQRPKAKTDISDKATYFVMITRSSKIKFAPVHNKIGCALGVRHRVRPSNIRHDLEVLVPNGRATRVVRRCYLHGRSVLVTNVKRN